MKGVFLMRSSALDLGIPILNIGMVCLQRRQKRHMLLRFKLVGSDIIHLHSICLFESVVAIDHIVKYD